METEFIQYQQALELKELGFNEPCFHLDGLGKVSYAEFGYGATPIPLYSQAFRWFREKYDIHQSIIKYSGSKTYWCQIEMISDKKDKRGKYGVIYATNLSTFTKYRDAELACLKKLIQIIKEKL
ncbi:hypothetical protein UFOVP1247_63 [uncultured Caudovirales phage]|uniref:Uncharacterized protein n=1 Tax=uncultured Caudovirales phage TaxID=2100421 RepID=A0A6J5PXW9_9CAUD|nr:hypothetical protein UFOVP970_103 [uncultured Caudovirales phage]CAB4193358.1 hypothetical protein UFOVP1247_63 [uncultured Caudovirales phage]